MPTTGKAFLRGEVSSALSALPAGFLGLAASFVSAFFLMLGLMEEQVQARHKGLLGRLVSGPFRLRTNNGAPASRPGRTKLDSNYFFHKLA